jgi:AcrR family transcriptional regulator
VSSLGERSEVGDLLQLSCSKAGSLPFALLLASIRPDGYTSGRENKMGRKRVISEDQVLDAAQRVVVSKGAGQLTIEAVALQAGISKASVLYYYKTKRVLIKAVVDRIVGADAAINEAAINSLEGDKNAAIRGRIVASREIMTNTLRSVALNLCASVANEPQLRRHGKDYMNRTVERIRNTCDHPKGAMLAFLALEGVKLLELVDWHTWTASERKQLLKDIEWLIQTDPQESESPAKSASPSSANRTGGPSQAKRLKNSSGAAKTALKLQDRKKRRVAH